MTPAISVIVNGSAKPASLAACIDSLLNQKRDNWISEIIVAVPLDGTDEYDTMLIERQRKSAGRLRWLAGKPGTSTSILTSAVFSANSPWIAFLQADGIAPQDWAEKIFQGIERQQARNPRVVGLGGACRLVDIGGFSQSLNVLLDSPFAHMHSPLWWRPAAPVQVNFLSFANSIFSARSMQRALAAVPAEPAHALETRLGFEFKENGFLTVLSPEPVVMRRELGLPSVWLNRWREMGRAQELLDREVHPTWTLPTIMAGATGAIAVLTVMALPFTNWYSSFLWLYVLVMLNASAYAAFKVQEGKRSLSVFGWMVFSQLNFSAIYWGARFDFANAAIRNSPWLKTTVSAFSRYRDASANLARRLLSSASRRSSKLRPLSSRSQPHSEPGPRPSPKSPPAFATSPREGSNSMRFEIQSRPESEHLFAVDLGNQAPPIQRKPDSKGATSTTAAPPSPPPA